MQYNLQTFSCGLHGSYHSLDGLKQNSIICRHCLQLPSPYFLANHYTNTCENLLCSLVFINLAHIKHFYDPRLHCS